MCLTGFLKLGENLAGYLLVLWVPAVSIPGAVRDGAEQSPEPGVHLPFTGGDLMWFQLPLVLHWTSVLSLVQADVLGTHSASGVKPTLPPLHTLFQDLHYNH